MAVITIARRGDGRLDDSTLRAMFRLRHAIFHDRLGWDVTSDNGMEHDEYDEINPVYMIVKDLAMQSMWMRGRPPALRP